MGVDGVFRKVDMTGVDADIHAVQFDSVRGYGEIECVQRTVRNKPIDDISPFQFLLDRWTAAAPKPAPAKTRG